MVVKDECGMELGIPSRHGNEELMNERGASLTELLAVMSIITIVCVLSGPQWLALAGRLDGRGVTADIVGELQLAKVLLHTIK